MTQEPEVDKSDFEIKKSEVILAELVPSEAKRYQTSYSMIGTKREIDDIRLRIEKSDEDRVINGAKIG